ncbi:hypothetical protein JTE90_025274, partial [Oedothorax gibbosus]
MTSRRLGPIPGAPFGKSFPPLEVFRRSFSRRVRGLGCGFKVRALSPPGAARA